MRYALLNAIRSMRYSFLIAIREFAENAKTKGFWLGILLFPLLFAISLKVPRFLEKRATPTRYFAFIDHSGKFENAVSGAIDWDHKKQIALELLTYLEEYLLEPQEEETPGSARELDFDLIVELVHKAGVPLILNQYSSKLREDRPEFEEPKPRFVRVDLPEDIPLQMEGGELIKRVKPYLSGEKKIMVDGKENNLFAFLLVPKDIPKHTVYPSDLTDPISLLKLQEKMPRGVEYWCANLADTRLSNLLKESINQEIRMREYEAENVERELVARVRKTHINYSPLDPKKEEGKEKVGAEDTMRQWAPVGFVYLLWIIIFSVSMMLLNNTVEEKSNRIVEVLLSSVTAWELMLGKLLGIAAVGLTMLISWIISILGILHLQSGVEAKWAGNLFNVIQSSGLLPAFIIYFILGYLLYAGIFLAIGSICNTPKEAQNMQGPMMIVMIIPLITMGFIPKDPNGTLATFLSWIPIYSPFIMMNRAAADPPLFDLVGTFILMIFTIGLFLWLAGKIFRIGILRTGQPPKLLELIRWLKRGA